MYANYLKRENNPNKKWNLIRVALEHTTLALLAPQYIYSEEHKEKSVLLQFVIFYWSNAFRPRWDLIRDDKIITQHTI